MGSIKTVVYISNFFNHHQQPVSEAFFARFGSGYLFIETAQMPQERREMGWGVDQYPPYVITGDIFYANIEYYKSLITQADVVIIGSAPKSLIQQRVTHNKPTFFHSERPLKKGFELWKYPFRFLRWRMCGFASPSMYLLSASAYAAQDYSKFFLFRNRSFKWGYFPKTYQYDNIDRLLISKNRNSIIWIGRFIPFKHPELAVEIGKRLKQEGYLFEMRMIGTGPLLGLISDRIKQEGLENEIHLLGAMTPEAVRRHMEVSKIHIFTSDRREGWGAVLNESMNSACVPVADVDIGSVPYLIVHGKNGFQYADTEELYEKVKYLLDHEEICLEMGKAAYWAIITEWNAEKAVRRFVALAECLLGGTGISSEGEVCSKAR